MPRLAFKMGRAMGGHINLLNKLNITLYSDYISIFYQLVFLLCHPPASPVLPPDNKPENELSISATPMTCLSLTIVLKKNQSNTSICGYHQMDVQKSH